MSLKLLLNWNNYRQVYSYSVFQIIKYKLKLIKLNSTTSNDSEAHNSFSPNL